MRRLRAVVGRVVRTESARVARRDSSAARKKFSVRDNLACAVGVMSAVGCSDGFSGDGDRGEFEAFARRAAPSLLRSAFLLCGDRGHAEDLLQMTFWRTAQRWVLAREAPNAYAYRVLVNLSRDRRRGQRRRVSEWLGSDDRAGVDLDQSERFAQRDVMSRAVRRLPDRQREVIVLRFYLDLSIAQTAAALGSSEGTVKSHTARALTRMRELLASRPPGPRPFRLRWPMLSDEQLIERIRTELRSELADLNPPPDLFDRLLEPAESDSRSQRGSRERSADRRGRRGWRVRVRGLGAAVPVLAGVIVVLVIAAVALTSVRHHQASSPVGPAVAARNGKVAFIAFGGGGYRRGETRPRGRNTA